ncbi:peptidoglycan editing factor PgeF [Pseudidiomarina gelatinasegens]|uniref:Purine nucleoside phosphorylase n=1 Tax=Pseudidiomarina gelatinasegens TaxID=2487740 RepID=A0A443YVM6_9GAMM|nr:peptidoglycan editing factor PgeF [Pseudidiomarina gelatinasegens]RWU08051.1 peptidoglycan editing factor PgeF [Pseudidiomarina gelatinasegens]
MLMLDWALPPGIHAAISTVAQPGNVAAHVGADPAAVIRNRRALQRDAQLPCAPRWLAQIHSNQVVNFSEARPAAQADAIYSNQPESVCAVLTADCLPILLCSDNGNEIAAVHAGWRGLANGVIQNTLRQFQCPPQQIQAFIGPAISVAAFEVGDDVRAAFAELNLVDLSTFRPHKAGKWLADLPLLAERMLQAHGCLHIKQSGWCTYNDLRWYSYRRDAHCGRFASMIWKN